VDELILRILKVFEDNGLFDAGIQLIGSWCFKMYQRHLGAPSFPLRTTDIDFLIPYPYKGRDSRNLVNELEKVGFQYDFKSDGSLFMWNSDLKIEFITTQKGRGHEGAVRIAKLGITAIPLRFVDLLLENSITVQEDNVEILLPRPVNFCLHKLLIASRRSKEDKRLKDLQQAICTSVITEPPEMQGIFRELPKPWKRRILRILGEAKAAFPLLSEEINRLESTLQNA
jgi:hypothetical protein